MQTYLRLISFAKPYGKLFVPFFFFSLFGIVFGLFRFTLLIPVLNVLFGLSPKKEIPTTPPAFSLNTAFLEDTFNYHLYRIMGSHGKFEALVFVTLTILVATIAASACVYMAQRVVESARVYAVRNLRKAVFDRVISLHLGFFSNERKGDIMARLTTDVQEVEHSVANTMNGVFKEPVALIGYFVVLFVLSYKLTLFTLIIIPLSGLLIAGVTKRLKKDAKEVQESSSRLMSIIEESLGGLRVIKAFNAAEYIKSKFDTENNRYRQLARSVALKREASSPLSEVMGIMVVVTIVLYGGSLVLSNQSTLSASEFIVYIGIFSQVLQPAKGISTAFSHIQRGLASGRRVIELLDTVPQVTERPDAKPFKPFASSIQFESVSFAYDQASVLRNISFAIPKGQCIALVGPSGGGKSTIADLIPRFYDVSSGRITIDGTDIREYSIDSLRAQMGIVTQQSILFNDTIFNNIAFGIPNASREEVMHAAKIANAHHFIMETENGYDTVIGDRGSKLSGGQQQRISIARAVFKNPPILILDEATSALDTESEKLVQEALTNLMKDRTSLVIAHRLSTVQHADEILVIQGGKIVERGSHTDLLTDEKGLYRRLNLLQTT